MTSPLINSRFISPPRLQPLVPKLGLNMNGSIAFNGTDEDLRIASFSSSGPNSQTFTYSAWIKQNTTVSFEVISVWFSDTNNLTRVYMSGANSAPTYQDYVSGSSQALEVEASTFTADTWYHLVVAVDTTLATGADRVRMYLDGAEQSPTTETIPTQNDNTFFFSNGIGLFIGQSGVGALYWGGNMADIIVVEGQQLTPAEFGYDNGGTWSWKDYKGPYGTHGFRINPQDSSQVGTDQSGNGNNFTLTNMDTSNFDGADLPPV